MPAVLESRVVFFTGAGLSAESGIPTYRGRGGIWAEYRYEEYACQAAFDRDPTRVLDFHDVRRRTVGAARPNAGHEAVAAVPHATVVTQNIDGLHHAAGSRDVLELHGSLWRVRCGCGVREDRTVPMEPRRCADCGAWRRPDIVWFGDVVDSGVLAGAARAIEACDWFVSVGTSASVYPAADLPFLAARTGARLVEINLEDTPLSHLYHHRLRGPASKLLPEVVYGGALD